MNKNFKVKFSIFIESLMILTCFICLIVINPNKIVEHVTYDEKYTGQAVDTDGNLLAPFDVVYREEFNTGNYEYDEHSLLIKMDDNYDGSLTDNFRIFGAKSIESFLDTKNSNWYRVRLKNDIEIKQAIRDFRSLEEVIMVDYDYVYRAERIETTLDTSNTNPVAPDGNGAETDGLIADVIGNLLAKDQWHLKECEIQKAWNFLKSKGINPGGLSTVTVAVIDTGVDYNHPDLKSNMWVNTGEIPNNQIDDDNNGYIDDVYGANVVANNGNGDTYNTGNPMDDNGHGTHVAGIIGAANNKEGIVGIAYNCKIMAVKASPAAGLFLQSDIAEAIMYAYQMGADVINMSFGGSACSIAVQDALAEAYTTSTLVASAGNNGLPNEDYLGRTLHILPNYPAALSYVIGVMSVNQFNVESSFTNFDGVLYSKSEYELYAPGENILSTLPQGRYGKLSGTSMASPVVAGVAALLRSYFTDRDMYPSKYIAAQLVATSEKFPLCCDPFSHRKHNIPMVLNAYDAFNKLPKPDVRLYNHYLFDNESIAKGNSGDGVIDAGETINIAAILRNRWGMSKNTIVTIDAIGKHGEADPYVEIVKGTSNFNSVGTYSTKDNLIRSEDKIVTGVDDPLTIRIKENCPNDYLIKLTITIKCENALDESDKTVYINDIDGDGRGDDKIQFYVRNGIILPNQITENMTLTKDNYYIIPNSTYIHEDVTVIVEPGTNIQFWTDDPGDPYADTYMAKLNVAGKFITKGSVDEPVNIFPSEMMAEYQVEIFKSDKGIIELNYTNVINPVLDVNYIDHCNFKQNYTAPYKYRALNNNQVLLYQQEGSINSSIVRKSSFYKLGGNNESYNSFQFNLKGKYIDCLFAGSSIKSNETYNPTIFKNCIFLGNNVTNDNGYVFPSNIINYNFNFTINEIYRNENTGATYISINNCSCIREFAKMLGGDLACIETKEEKDFFDYHNIYGFVGTLYKENKWINGKPIDDFVKLIYPTYEYGFYGAFPEYHPAEQFHIIEIPGEVYTNNIFIKEKNITIDLNSKFQIDATANRNGFDDNKLIYVSDDESIATVDKNGLVTPLRKGNVNIYIYSPDYIDKSICNITIGQEIPIKELNLSTKMNYINVGEKIKLNVDFIPENTTKRHVIFSSDNSNFIVDKNGIVTVIGEGEGTITANVDCIKSSIKIFSGTQLEKIEFSKGMFITYIGDTNKDWKPTLVPINATNVKLMWESSNPEVAYVDENGELIRVSVGNATLRVTALNQNVFNEIVVSVSDYEIPSVQIRQAFLDDYDTYVVLEDNTLWTWGYHNSIPIKLMDNVLSSCKSSYGIYIINTLGELEEYEKDFTSKRKLKFNLNNCKKIVSDNLCNFVIKNDGTVWGWGLNEYGQLGDGTLTNKAVPTQMNIFDVIDVAPTIHTATVLKKNGEVFVFGTEEKYLNGKLLIDNIESLCIGDNDIIFNAYDGMQFSYEFGNLKNLSVDVKHFPNEYTIKNGIANTKTGNTIGAGDFFFCTDETDSSSLKDVKDIIVLKGTIALLITENDEIFGIGANYMKQLDGFTSNNRVLKPVRIPIGLKKESKQLIVNSTNIKNNILLDDYIKLSFNESLHSYNYHSSYSFIDSNNNYISVKYTHHLNDLIITPLQKLKDGEQYTLTIPKNDVRSIIDNRNDEIKYIFTYLDNQQIQLLDKNIEDGQNLLKNNINLKFKYSFANQGEAFNNICITENGIKKESITISLVNNILSITGNLPKGNYVLTIPEKALEDNIGGFNTTININFSVDSELNLLSSSINDKDIRVNENDAFTFNFDEPLQPINLSNITLKAEDETLVNVTPEILNNDLIINHDTLKQSTNYTLTIPEGTFKNALEVNNSLITMTFRTYEPTKLLYSSVKDGSVVDRYPELKFEFTYIKKIDESKITIFKDTSKVLLSTNVYENILKVTPSGLNSGQKYTIVIDKGAIIDDRNAPNEKIIFEFMAITIKNRVYYNVNNLQKYKDEFVKLGYNNNLEKCVILNNLNDTNIENWLKFVAEEGRGSINLTHIYWGTTNKEIINKQIFDFEDNQSLKDIVEDPILTLPPELPFPYITDVYLLNGEGERVFTVGNETVTIVVEFSKDMDQTIPLRVRFGSSFPFAEYEIDGKYVNARRWEGTYTLKTTIENGNQYFNISNGCAADDKFMKLFTFPGRFMFELDTSTAQSMIMNATANKDGIQLNWTQDDFDTLLGYNLYRSTSEDGLYERINDVVLSPEIKEFFDANVEPGTRYYYNFTVVKTDLSESLPSGKTFVTSFDTMAPNIYHSPVRTGFTDNNILVHATITDNLNVNTATLFYRIKGTSDWKSVIMHSLNDRYTGVIPASDVTLDGIEYYINATDGNSNANKGSSTNPYVITVKLGVDANSLGDVDGDGTITTKDALMLLQAANDQLNLNAEQFARADINGDKTLSAMEALRILQYVSGKVTTIPF